MCYTCAETRAGPSRATQWEIAKTHCARNNRNEPRDYNGNGQAQGGDQPRQPMPPRSYAPVEQSSNGADTNPMAAPMLEAVNFPLRAACQAGVRCRRDALAIAVSVCFRKMF